VAQGDWRYRIDDCEDVLMGPQYRMRQKIREMIPWSNRQLQWLRMPGPYMSELVREKIEATEERRLLSQARGIHEACWLQDDEPEPLVSVRIGTYNRGPLVVDRAIASALRQTYEHLEILVIGDHCDASTEAAVRSVRDPRIRFINLPQRGLYPEDPIHRWLVAGTAPMNAAIAIAQGAWMAPCDDDDEFTDDHVEVLLEAARSRNLEFVWSKADMEVEPKKWVEVGSDDLGGGITHGSVMYASGLRFFRYNNSSWKLSQPGDWNMWNRMRRAGVKMGFVDKVTYRHYVETVSVQDGVVKYR